MVAASLVVGHPSRGAPPRPAGRDDRPAGVPTPHRPIRGTTAPGRCPERRAYLLGWGVTLRYGLMALNPLGNRSLASSSETAGTMITSSPSFQLTGVATL